MDRKKLMHFKQISFSNTILFQNWIQEIPNLLKRKRKRRAKNEIKKERKKIGEEIKKETKRKERNRRLMVYIRIVNRKYH